jgi:hypothetical protein
VPADLRLGCLARVRGQHATGEFLADVSIPALQRHYDYWWQTHGAGDALFTGGFLGMDNLPRSPGQPQADATAWMAFFARDMARIASELRDQASRALLDRPRAHPGRDQRAACGTTQTASTTTCSAEGGFMLHKSYSGLVPLIAGVVPERAAAVLESCATRTVLSPGGIRSLSADSSLYSPGWPDRGVNSNWRGPVWLPINYLLVARAGRGRPVLRRDLREPTRWHGRARLAGHGPAARVLRRRHQRGPWAPTLQAGRPWSPT